jgi:hypothetical protein
MSDLQTTVQRQSDTIEALHAASAQYKARADAAEHLAAGRLSEAEMIRALQADNQTLRHENFSLTERVKDLEASISRSAEASSLTAESQAQLGVQVRAYQRHNHFLQGEVSARDAKMRALEERVEVMTEELKTKERRMGLMMDRLRKHNVDVAKMNEQQAESGGSAPARVTVPEATLQQIREKMAMQTSTIEILRDRLESVEDEAGRKEHVLKSLRRENDALKNTISKMVSQISSEVSTQSMEMQLTGDALTGGGFSSSSSGAGASSGDASAQQQQQQKDQHSGHTGAPLLLGLGGAATGNTGVVANQMAFVESDQDAESRLRQYRNQRLEQFAPTK